MILISGATGTSGQQIVQETLTRGAPIRVLVRDTAKAAVQLGDEVEIARGDFSDPMSVEAAMEGVDRTLLLSPPSNQLIETEKSFVDAAKRSGVKHIVKFSAMGAAPDSTEGFCRWHGISEAYIKQSGLAWTMLRPPFFMQNLLGLASMIHAGTVYQPAGDGKAGFVDVRDIASVAASALSEDGHENKSYDITGPALLSWHDIAAILTRQLGREIKYVDVPPEASKQSMMQSGMLAWQADAVNALLADLKAGKFARLTDSVEKIGHKTPTTLEEFVRENAAALNPT